MTHEYSLDDAPSWVEDRDAYLALTEQNLTDLQPWEILSVSSRQKYQETISGLYPERNLFVFAHKTDGDDVACFEKYDGGTRISIIHAFASKGWELTDKFDSLWDWFRAAVEDMINWHA